MGKQLEKLIVILGIILMGSAVFATPATDIIPSNDPVVVTRKQAQQKTNEPKTKQVEKKKVDLPKTKPSKTTNRRNPQYIGLKIYEINKTKPQNKPKISNKDKCKCACNREKISPCEAKKLKPIKVYKTPKPARYSRVYPDRYRKHTLPKYPPAKLPLGQVMIFTSSLSPSGN